MIRFQFIDQRAQLDRLASELEGASELALDTEFMRERTYYPKLCLVQLATANAIACIDPLALGDVAHLSSLLARGATPKVAHAARQDVEALLTRSVEPPAPLFDTQIAAALLGMQPQIGYGELVHKVLGAKLAKAHARTDWSVRPLSPEQLEYAADDVRHLLPLHEVLRRDLEKRDRLHWFDAEMTRAGATFATRLSPADAWQRLKGLESLDPRRRATALALSRWREARAMQRDRPRGWILSDEALYDIVRALPQDRAQLERLRSLPPGVIENCGVDLLAAVQGSAHLTSSEPQRRAPRPDPAAQARLKLLAATVKRIAEQLQLTPEVLATRRDLQQLLNGDTDVAPLKGWRREVVGEALLSLL
ncbi:MAG TPA: ribonuclease D [Steroidobacteraceae bacterium]|nr:ribonuclease D [Steroidobacteraceae bacterium]